MAEGEVLMVHARGKWLWVNNSTRRAHEAVCGLVLEGKDIDNPHVLLPEGVWLTQEHLDQLCPACKAQVVDYKLNRDWKLL